jgi:hypothetical protein
MKTLPTIARSVLFTSVFAALIPALPGARAEDWNLESVLRKVEEANGGINAIESTTNLRVRGTVEAEGVTYDFLLLKKRPDKVRIHLMHKGRSIETGFDGTTGWRRTWIQGQDRVAVLSEAELASANLDIDFDGPLIGEPLPGISRSYLGMERIDRVDYFVVLVESELHRTRHFIDSRTFREWRTIREILKDGEVEGEVVTTYFQYKRHKTIWLAERVERLLPGRKLEVITVTDAEVDPGLLDRVFAVPKQWASDQ